MRVSEVLVELLSVQVDRAVCAELALRPDDLFEQLARVVVLEENLSFVAVGEPGDVLGELRVLLLRNEELDTSLSANDAHDVLLFGPHLEVAPRTDNRMSALADSEEFCFLGAHDAVSRFHF